MINWNWNKRISSLWNFVSFWGKPRTCNTNCDVLYSSPTDVCIHSTFHHSCLFSNASKYRWILKYDWISFSYFELFENLVVVKLVEIKQQWNFLFHFIDLDDWIFAFFIVFCFCFWFSAQQITCYSFRQIDSDPHTCNSNLSINNRHQAEPCFKISIRCTLILLTLISTRIRTSIWVYFTWNLSKTTHEYFWFCISFYCIIFVKNVPYPLTQFLIMSLE